MIDLHGGRYRAAVNPHGASLAALSCDGRDVLIPQDGRGGPPTFHGAVLAPWPNRIHDGAYDFGGETHRLPINEPARHTAIHGLVYDQQWETVEATADTCTHLTRVEPRSGYPYALRLRIVHTLGADGLTVRLEATNTGEDAAPYGCGFHPYFTSGDAPVDRLKLLVEADQRLGVTTDRMVPIGLRDVAGTAYDLRGGQPLGAQHIDDAYAEVGRVRLGDVEVWRDESLPWVQVFTPPGREAIALEPCSCPADAFRSGEGLVVLEPGADHTVRWGVRVSSGPA